MDPSPRPPLIVPLLPQRLHVAPCDLDLFISPDLPLSLSPVCLKPLGLLRVNSSWNILSLLFLFSEHVLSSLCIFYSLGGEHSSLYSFLATFRSQFRCHFLQEDFPDPYILTRYSLSRLPKTPAFLLPKHIFPILYCNRLFIYLWPPEQCYPIELSVIMEMSYTHVI